MTNQSLAEIPVLQATEQAFESINLDDKLQVAYIECKSVNMPEYFRTDKFTIQFMTRGTLTAEINHQHFTIHAPAIIFISPNYILHPIHVSEESLMYVLIDVLALASFPLQKSLRQRFVCGKERNKPENGRNKQKSQYKNVLPNYP